MTQPRNKAVFLDRDGTLNEDVDYLSRIEDLRIFQFTRPALSRLKSAGFLLIVITNQSGIGRGFYDARVLHAIHNEMQRQLDELIDAFYFCPHLPGDACECRKPKLGMIERAVADFDIDLSLSWMVGDKDVDVEAGKAAGTRTILVQTGYGKLFLDSEPDAIAGDLLGAARIISELS